MARRGAPRRVRVPDLVGMASQDAAKLLREVGLRAGLVRFERSRDFETGIVIGHKPPARSMVERGTPVALTVSSGRLQ
jgi:eukaryotic-like serine/threonine-protein kinase